MKNTRSRAAPRNDAPENEEPGAWFLPACNNTSLRRAARRLGSLYDAALEPLGLKATQLGLMAEIERVKANGDQGQEPTLQELATNLAIQISALTHALRPLVRDGLIELQADERDKRAKRAVLTPEGIARLHAALAGWAEVNQRFEAVLGVEAAAALRAVADHVASDEFMSAFEADGEGRR